MFSTPADDSSAAKLICNTSADNTNATAGIQFIGEVDVHQTYQLMIP
jgi:hypothetical protein